MTIADLKRGEFDESGNRILRFYARQPPVFAVYQTVQRVGVQYADDAALADEQRKALSQLAPVRGEINGLLQSWRDAPDVKSSIRSGFGLIPMRNRKLRARADRYDRRVADALLVAFEGDLTGAGQIFADIKADILDERTGWARIEYLLFAFFFATVLIGVASVASHYVLQNMCFDGRTALCFGKAADLWRGAMTGAYGAFFSIAIAIRGRTILPDLHRAANLNDAGLRITIGIIAGTVLVALILDGFVSIAIGESRPTGPQGSLYIAIAGFLAGFSERMVPDLLASAAAKTGQPPIVRMPLQNGPANGANSGPNPGRGPGNAPAATVQAASPPPDPQPDQTGVDCCLSALQLSDDELTRDEDLPVASGGIAAMGAGQ